METILLPSVKQQIFLKFPLREKGKGIAMQESSA